MLKGLHRQSGVHMPGFAAELSDTQLTTLGNYILHRWGNPEAQVTEAQVTRLRSGSQSSSLLILARVGMVAAVFAAIALVGLGLRRRRHR